MQVKPSSVLPVQDSDGVKRTEVPFGPFSAVVAAQKPMRLNNASVCLYCDTRWCVAQKCTDRHAASLWIVCVECDGFADVCEPHYCVGGVVETDRAGYDAQPFRALPMTAPDDGTGEYVVAQPIATGTVKRVGPWGVGR